METAILMGLIGLGYLQYLNKTTNDRSIDKESN